MANRQENLNNDFNAQVKLQNSRECCVCQGNDPLFLVFCLGCKKVYCWGRHNDWKQFHDAACTTKIYQAVSNQWSERISNTELASKALIYENPSGFPSATVRALRDKYKSGPLQRPELVHYLETKAPQYFQTTSTRISVKDAKLRVSNKASSFVKVVLEKCNCSGWKPFRNHNCPLTEARVVQRAEELLNIPDSCSLQASFRQDTLCPKTGCDNGGTRGGWCANIMPDGSYHCLHCWCHNGPCCTTVHYCTLYEA